MPARPLISKAGQQAFDECHVYRRWWRPTTVDEERDYYIQHLVCERCDMERRWRVNRHTGDPEGDKFRSQATATESVNWLASSRPHAACPITSGTISPRLEGFTTSARPTRDSRSGSVTATRSRRAEWTRCSPNHLQAIATNDNETRHVSRPATPPEWGIRY
jgi:hypothetical protein